MLAPDYLDTLPDALVELFQQVEDDILRDIARRINKMGGLTSTAAWQAWRLEQARAVHSDVVRTLAKYSGKADAEIRRILQDAGATALAADDTIYRVMGFAPSDISTNPALLNLLNAGYRQTLGSWKISPELPPTRSPVNLKTRWTGRGCKYPAEPSITKPQSSVPWMIWRARVLKRFGIPPVTRILLKSLHGGQSLPG